MSTSALFYACQVGDLQKVQYCVDQDVEVNVRDCWDSTPLYYACLCGHEDVVEYLLENGAVCEPNTFDGERCIYGALTDKIRNVLKSHRVLSTRTKQRCLYNEFLRKMLDHGRFCDVTFVVHGQEFPLHKCVLSVRSEFFREMFEGKWQDKSVIPVTHPLLRPEAFGLLMTYLYTGHVEIKDYLVEDFIRLSKQVKLDHVVNDIENEVKKMLDYSQGKLGVTMTVVTLDPKTSLYKEQLESDFSRLVLKSLPKNRPGYYFGELPFHPVEQQLYPDICFSVDGYEFMCHKAFVCGRSDYFRALISDHFGENQTCHGGISKAPIHDVSPDLFLQIVSYIYTNQAEISLDNVHSLLLLADVYLMPGLKKQCASFMSGCLTVDNVVEALNIARMFGLPGLEDRCAKFIADHIKQVIDLEEFVTFVQEDARAVKQRQETDSIPIIDDIRFYINFFVRSFSDTEDARNKHILIDELLECLGLDG